MVKASEGEVRVMLAEKFGVPAERLTPQAELASLGIDSLALIEFMFEIEERFAIRLPAAPAPPGTLAAIVDHLGRAQPAPTDPQR